MSESIRADLVQQLDMLSKFDNDALLARRYETPDELRPLIAR